MVRVGISSLGCARNQVDSEVMLGSLKKSGFEIGDVEDGVDILIVNTCAFMRSARDESIDAILEASRLKRSGRIKRLVISGCLPQLYKGRLLKEIAEADLVLGTGDLSRIADFIKALAGEKRLAHVSPRPDYLYDERTPRFLLTPGHYAYVKISEGCSNLCSYCIISRLRGTFRSRSIESVIREIKKLAKSGKLKEINLIGQDTTYFGTDRYGRAMLPYLLKNICGLRNGVRWVRLLYTHPAHYTDELIAAIRREEKICKYLDLPIQHISDHILERMNRRTTKSGITGLINKLRDNIPGIVLRTSVIVGFPGEKDKDFNELMRFLRRVKFERLGAFIYSREEGTPSSRLAGHLPEKIKQERFDLLMSEQRDISGGINKRLLGKKLDVLIDEKIEGEKDMFIGRGPGDAPEIDQNIYVTGRKAKVGEFCDVRIVDTMEYDMAGKAL